MDFTEYLLVCIMEECGEITKEASKCIRFGLESDAEGKKPVTNIKALVAEFNDLMALLEMLNIKVNGGNDFCEIYDIKHIKEKEMKTLEMMKHYPKGGLNI